LISSAGFYGAESVAVGLAETLERRGVFARLGVFRNRRRPNLEIAEVAEARGLRCYELDCRGQIDPRAILALRRLLRKERIDIVHSHETKSNVYGLLSTWGTGVRTVATCHNWIGTGRKIRFYNVLDKLLLKFLDRVAAVSGPVRDEAIRFGVDSREVVQIDNAIDHTKFEVAEARATALRESLGLEPGRPVVGTISRLSDEKNIETLLDAFHGVTRRQPGARLLIIGDGPHRSELERRTASLGIDDAVRFLGVRRDVPELLSIMDVFVLASLREGMPMVVLEAMAAAKPVVATAIGAIPTVIEHERSGILVPDPTPDAVGARIVRLLAEPAEAREMGRAARRVVRERFSAERMADDYLQLYEEALRS